jgi:hypothetical protein
MNIWQGQTYFDDRVFILDLQKATKAGKIVWAVTTRRNVQGFPPRRVDDFPTKEEATSYLKMVEPSTPRISLQGASPSPELTYEEHLEWCAAEGIPSCMDIHELNQGNRGELIIDQGRRLG